MFNSQFLRVALVAALTLLLNGCGLAYTLYQDDRAVDRTAEFRELKIGMTTAEVLDTVGKPRQWDESHWTYRAFFDVEGEREYRDVELYFKKDQLIVAEGVPGAPLRTVDRGIAQSPAAANAAKQPVQISGVESDGATGYEADNMTRPEVRTSDVIAALQNWADAWSKQNVDAYIDSYIDTYTPSGSSHEQWAALRRVRVSRPDWVDVSLDEVNVRVNGPGSATVTFLQNYKSDRYRDQTAKTLEFRQVARDWKITSEKAGRVSMAAGRAPRVEVPVIAAVAADADAAEMGIRAAVLAWASAWSAQDVDDYIDSYVVDYSPSGSTHGKWTAQRRQRLTRPKSIRVSVTDLTVNVVSTQRAVATFRQSYQSDRYQDRDSKRLEFTRVDGEWKISAEKSGVVLPTVTSAPAVAKSAPPAIQPPATPPPATPQPMAKPTLPPVAATAAAPTTVKPTIAPATAAAVSAVDARKAVRRAIEDWLSAWTSKDVAAYIAAYSADYAPSGKSHSQWVADRRRKFGAAGDIRITLSEESVRIRSPETAVARFRQVYEAGNYRDRVSKTLELRRYGSDWKIVSETSR